MECAQVVSTEGRKHGVLIQLFSIQVARAFRRAGMPVGIQKRVTKRCDDDQRKPKTISHDSVCAIGSSIALTM